MEYGGGLSGCEGDEAGASLGGSPVVSAPLLELGVVVWWLGVSASKDCLGAGRSWPSVLGGDVLGRFSASVGLSMSGFLLLSHLSNSTRTQNSSNGSLDGAE